MYMYMYMYTYTYMYMYMYIYMYMHTYIHTYIHAYMHACMHTSMHTYILTYIRMCYAHLSRALQIIIRESPFSSCHTCCWYFSCWSTLSLLSCSTNFSRLQTKRRKTCLQLPSMQRDRYVDPGLQLDGSMARWLNSLVHKMILQYHFVDHALSMYTVELRLVIPRLQLFALSLCRWCVCAIVQVRARTLASEDNVIYAYACIRRICCRCWRVCVRTCRRSLRWIPSWSSSRTFLHQVNWKSTSRRPSNFLIPTTTRRCAIRKQTMARSPHVTDSSDCFFCFCREAVLQRQFSLLQRASSLNPQSPKQSVTCGE